MNTSAKPNLRISARFLGPVISLDGELAAKPRNLIFARNGTGKSFLSRALRCLDLHAQGKAISDAPRNLVSDESSDGRGNFQIARGETPLGQLQLDKKSDAVKGTVGDVIFHVFSEDFVHEELREQKYKLNGEIENEIAVDSSNIKLKEAQAELAKSDSAAMVAHVALGVQLEQKKEKELIGAAAIKKTLKEYSGLTLDAILANNQIQPKRPKRTTTDICNDLTGLKSIPALPTFPAEVEPSQTPTFEAKHFSELQSRITSPSSVSDAIKQKINRHTEFFRTGTSIVDESKDSTCPFCDQDISTPHPKNMIEAYIKYFADAEERHKSDLRGAFEILNRIEANLKDTEKQILVQKTHYDDLNRLFPSRKDEQLADATPAIAAVQTTISSLKEGLKAKTAALSKPGPTPDTSLPARLTDLKHLTAQNNAHVSALNQAVHNSDAERKKLQREACDTFSTEFVIQSWAEMEALKAAKDKVEANKKAVAAIEKAGPSSKAKLRVAETFDMLLKAFFGPKYIFDKATFTLKRGDKDMARGIHRTLSDGEKSAIAFCYFVASIQN